MVAGSDISTDNTMILDNDTIAQKESWMLSDYECDYYSQFTLFSGKCESHSMEIRTDPKWLNIFTDCITLNFLSEMGANRSCSNGSLKPDSDTNDNNKITLLSKDRLFYNFVLDTLDAGNTCQTTNDAVTFSPDNCGWYIRLMRRYAGSRCTYDTASTDGDTELRYDYCLDYRLMKSLGADSVCKDWALIFMCSLFGFMKEWLQEADISTVNTMILDNDTIAQKESWMLSDYECDY